MDQFAAIADADRRLMLERLREGERAAGELGQALPHASQPGVSRHLRVLREAGLVQVRREGQRQMYALQASGFAALETWIARYRDFWPAKLDALSDHLDRNPGPKAKKTAKSK